MLQKIGPANWFCESWFIVLASSGFYDRENPCKIELLSFARGYLLLPVLFHTGLR
jgi:hypothetical protein